MSREKKPKREFRPRSHATIYVVGIVYIGFLIADFIKKYRAGGPDAPSTALLVGGVAALGIVIILLGVLAWRMYTMPEPEEKEKMEKSENIADDEDSEEI